MSPPGINKRSESFDPNQEKKNLKGVEKAAIFLMFLGEELSTDVFRDLTDDEIQLIVREIPKIGHLPPMIIGDVVEEFQKRVAEEGLLSEIGKNFVEKVVCKALTPDKAKQTMLKLSHSEKLENIKKYDPRTVYNLIKKEHPQTISFVLSHLPPFTTGEIITRLPEDLQYEVVVRMARMDNVLPGTIEDVVEALSKDLSAFRMDVSEATGGAKAAAEILNMMKKSECVEIMRRLEEEDPDLAEEISQNMFVFEDLLNVDDKGIQLILRDVSNEDLAISLKLASEEVKSKIFKNVSTRAADMIKDDMEARGPVRLSEVEKAQQLIIRIARKLEQEGKIVISGRGGEDVFV